MKKNYLLFLIIFAFSFTKGFSQHCNNLGCAAANSFPTGSVEPLIIQTNCLAPFDYREIYWQFFYSPTGGDFTQTFTATQDVDYVIYDNTVAGTTDFTCTIDPTGWTAVLCNSANTSGIPTGPGTDGTITTLAGHFYAVGIYEYFTAPGTLDISAPLIDGLPFTPANCPIALPLKLSSFGAKINNCVANLDWVTEQATNFKNFDVEYSTDGTKFNKIATLPSATRGNDVTKKYSYQHSSPGQGNIYYRLKMIDINGKFEYSKTIALKVDCSKSAVLVYPNPVTDLLHINITNSHNSTLASLFDNSGRMIYSEKLTNGTNSINMSKLAKGIYVLSLKNDETTQNIKITR